MVALTAFAGKQLAVVGVGKAGRAVIEALQAGGAAVIAWDDKPEIRQQLNADGIATAERLEAIDWASLEAMVLSPGVPLHHPTPHPAATLAQTAGCPIIGEVELLYRQYPPETYPEIRYIGITGTNGKSTTTALIGHVLESAGCDVRVGGNLGVASVALPEPGANSIYVLELSSYQLELTDQFHCNIAVLLNIAPDHLDRHGGMEGYVAAKARIFNHMSNDDLAIIGVDDPHSAGLLKAQQSEGVPWASIGGDALATTQIEAGQVTLQWQGNEEFYDLTQCPALQGKHNAQNAAAAILTARQLDIAPDVIRQGLSTYPGLAHRMEWLGEVDGIGFVNDSKATNADAAQHSLKAFDRVFWIAGGVAKEGDLLPEAIIRDHVEAAYLYGESAASMQKTIGHWVPAKQFETMAEAFLAATNDAYQAANKGEKVTVLLAPACASFDQYANFEARGEQFRHLALPLISDKVEGNSQRGGGACGR